MDSVRFGNALTDPVFPQARLLDVDLLSLPLPLAIPSEWPKPLQVKVPESKPNEPHASRRLPSTPGVRSATSPPCPLNSHYHVGAQLCHHPACWSHHALVKTCSSDGLVPMIPGLFEPRNLSTRLSPSLIMHDPTWWFPTAGRHDPLPSLILPAPVPTVGMLASLALGPNIPVSSESSDRDDASWQALEAWKHLSITPANDASRFPVPGI